MVKEPQKTFRGTWIPAKIFAIFEAGTINARDLVLLAMVDAYTDTDDGCWASNAFLGSKLQMTPESVGNSVSRLVSLGLLKRVLERHLHGTRRHLWVIFGPTPFDNGMRTPLANGINSFPSESHLIQRGEGAMALFEHLVIEGPDQMHLAWAEQLLKTLQHHRRVTGPASAKKWAGHLRQLAKDLDDDNERIHRVLEWYITHSKDKYVPRVYSASTFRSKFIPIEDAMKRQNPGLAVDVGPLAQRIADRLKGRSWPKGTAKDVAAVAQISLDAYGVFMTHLFEYTNKVDELPSTNRSRKRLLGLLQHLNNAMPAPAHFVEEWLKEVQRRVVGWTDWSGDLFVMAFDTHVERFRSIGRGLANSYCHDPDKWDLMMELMYEG